MGRLTPSEICFDTLCFIKKKLTLSQRLTLTLLNSRFHLGCYHPLEHNPYPPRPLLTEETGDTFLIYMSKLEGQNLGQTICAFRKEIL